MPEINERALQAMKTKLLRMGLTNQVSIGEPKKVSQGLTAAVIPNSGRVDMVSLNMRRELHVTTIRFYRPLLDDPAPEIEFLFDKARTLVLDDVFGDFELGGEVAWAEPTLTAWKYGYQLIGVTHCRLLDIDITYRLDPNAVLAP